MLSLEAIPLLIGRLLRRKEQVHGSQRHTQQGAAMNTIFAFAIEVILTFIICALTFKVLRPYLNRILIDLCGTEERAQFWTVFSNILLVGCPLLISLMYQPQALNAEELFFELTRRTSGNLIGFMFALMAVGFIVSIFALFAPRAKESK